MPDEKADGPDAALSALTKTIERNPASARGYVARGRYHAGAGRWPEALADANGALTLAPNDPHVRTLVAEAAPHLEPGR